MSDPARWLDGADLVENEREALRALASAGPERAQSGRMFARLTQLTSAPQVGAGAALRSSRWGWLTGALLIALLAAMPFARRPTPQPAASTPEPRSRARSVPTDGSPVPEAVSPSAPEPELPPSARAPTRKAAARDPGAELALLTPARQLLAVDPRRALALADEHARRFPRGTFREERAFLRIEALLRLARRPAAERDARAFLRAHPGSTYQHRLQQLLAPAP